MTAPPFAVKTIWAPGSALPMIEPVDAASWACKTLGANTTRAEIKQVEILNIGFLSVKLVSSVRRKGTSQ
jgi:hypothetical protein